MHSVIFSNNVTFFRGQRSSVARHLFSLTRFHNPFCAMKPYISNLFKSLWYSFLVILLLLPFNLPIPSLLRRDPAILKDLDPLYHFAVLLGAYLLRLAAVHQFRSHSLPRISRTFSAPQNFSLSVYCADQVVTSQLTLFFCSVHFPGIFMYLLLFPHLMHRYLLVSAHHSVRCFVASFFQIHENPLFFRLRLEFFTILPFLHHTVKAGCTLQSCAHLLLAPAAWSLLSPHLERQYLGTFPDSHLRAPFFALCPSYLKRPCAFSQMEMTHF